MRTWLVAAVITASTQVAIAAKIVQVSIDARRVCALRDDGHVRCWGGAWVSFGGPRIGPSSFAAVPVDVPGIDRAVAIQIVDNKLLALTADGHVQRTSLSNLEKIGTASVVANLENVVEIAGDQRPSVRFRDGTVAVLDGTTVRRTTLTDVIAVRGDFAIGKDGVVRFIGGRGDKIDERRIYVDDATGFVGRAIRRKSGELVTWNPRDAKIVTLESPPKAVDRAGTSRTTCAIVDGAVRCTGDNRYGQLGNLGPDRKDFIEVKLPARATQLAGDDDAFCALLADGELACWGANVGGQLGDGTLRDRGTPQLVTGATAATPPPYTNGFDKPHEGPAFDWKLPAGCRKAADMIGSNGSVHIAPLVSAYLYREGGSSSLVFGDFLLEPRSKAPGREPRGKQKSLTIYLSGTGPGRYTARSKTRSVSITSHTYDNFSMVGFDEDDDYIVQLDRFDERWLCGTLTVKFDGKSTSRPIAARVIK